MQARGPPTGEAASPVEGPPQCVSRANDYILPFILPFMCSVIIFMYSLIIFIWSGAIFPPFIWSLIVFIWSLIIFIWSGAIAPLWAYPVVATATTSITTAIILITCIIPDLQLTAWVTAEPLSDRVDRHHTPFPHHSASRLHRPRDCVRFTRRTPGASGPPPPPWARSSPPPPPPPPPHPAPRF